MGQQALPQNHFQWFGLTPGFQVDLAQLHNAYRAVQGSVHPDRHAAGSDQDRRLAMQMATAANEAFTVLRDPLKRAIYLCEMYGIAVEDSGRSSLDTGFLMQQMQWREEAEEARAKGREDVLANLRAEIGEHEKALQTECATLLAPGSLNVGAAAGLVQRWMFLRKFSADLAPAY
jgi:molecular chaperone HscB